ncbi:AAA family ATPase, partial [Streptomyces sp. FT05W]
MPAHEESSNPLVKERDHLAASRAALRAMREDVQALDIRDVTANWVNAAVLQAQIDDRIKALADLSHTPLFFGRLDYLHAVGAEKTEGAEGEQFYIGRRHVHDAHGDPMVID